MEIDFEAVYDIINSISAGKGQYPIYFQSYIKNIYNQTNKWASKHESTFIIDLLNRQIIKQYSLREKVERRNRKERR